MTPANTYKQLASDFFFAYATLMGLCALLKVSTPLWGRPVWIFGDMPWAEIFTGPAFAIVMGYAAPRFADYLVARRKRRRV